jgi:hypothetical protein
MDGKRNRISRALRGPIGGVVATLVLALVLGGVAMANPGGTPNDHAVQTSSPSPDDPTGSADGQEQQTGDQGSAPAAHTATDCTDATADVQADLPTEDEATGLAHAIYVVGANCEKNLQAPGLVVALQHLVVNFQRHQDHLAAMAEKAASRGAQTHGNSGIHGGSGSSHGHASEHGPSSEGS